LLSQFEQQHNRRIDASRVKPQRLKSPIEQISRRFVPRGNDAEIGGRNSEILRYACHFERTASASSLTAALFAQNDFRAVVNRREKRKDRISVHSTSADAH
jgi:hypothetical protein